jgi:MFS family permease
MSEPAAPKTPIGPQLAQLVRRMRIDTSALRSSRDYRLLWFGGSVSFIGSMVTYVALPYQVAELTNSYVAVGAIGLVELGPLIVFGLYGGALADAVDRRRLVLITESCFTVVSAILMVNAFLPHPALWLLYVAALAYAVLDGLQRPSLDALIPRIVAPEHLAGAGALNSLRMNIGTIAGPAIGGVVIAIAGVAAAYALDVVSYAASLVAVALMSAVPPTVEGTKASLRGIGEGLAYAWSRKDLLGTYAVDLAAMTFAFPFALFPFVAKEFHAPWSLGFLYAAPEVGSLIATLTSGWASRMHHHGRCIAVAAMCWGLAITAFGLAPTLPLALFFLVLAGAADMVSGLFRGLMWNLTIPDEVRGRMAGIELLSYSIGPTLGQVRAGFSAQLTSLRISLATGGFITVFAVGAVVMLLPGLWRFDDRTDENAIRQRRLRDQMGGST